jgi:hypothetical protein
MYETNYHNDYGCSCMDDGYDSFGNPDNLDSPFLNKLRSKKTTSTNPAVKPGVFSTSSGKPLSQTIKKPNVFYSIGGVMSSISSQKRADLVNKNADRNLDAATRIADAAYKTKLAQDIANGVYPGSTSGQMGSETGATTMNSTQAAMQSSGGGGGDVGGDYTADIEDAGTGSGSSLSTATNPKVEAGVTVKSHKTNLLMIGVLVLAIAVAVYFIIKYAKKKK